MSWLPGLSGSSPNPDLNPEDGPTDSRVEGNQPAQPPAGDGEAVANDSGNQAAPPTSAAPHRPLPVQTGIPLPAPTGTDGSGPAPSSGGSFQTAATIQQPPGPNDQPASPAGSATTQPASNGGSGPSRAPSSATSVVSQAPSPLLSPRATTRATSAGVARGNQAPPPAPSVTSQVPSPVTPGQQINAWGNDTGQPPAGANKLAAIDEGDEEAADIQYYQAQSKTQYKTNLLTKELRQVLGERMEPDNGEYGKASNIRQIWMLSFMDAVLTWHIFCRALCTFLIYPFIAILVFIYRTPGWIGRTAIWLATGACQRVRNLFRFSSSADGAAPTDLADQTGPSSTTSRTYGVAPSDSNSAKFRVLSFALLDVVSLLARAHFFCFVVIATLSFYVYLLCDQTKTPQFHERRAWEEMERLSSALPRY